MHSTHSHNGAISRSIKFGVKQRFFLRRLDDNTFCIYRQYISYRKLLRYSSLVVILSNFARRHKAVAAWRLRVAKFSDHHMEVAFNQ